MQSCSALGCERRQSARTNPACHVSLLGQKGTWLVYMCPKHNFAKGEITLKPGSQLCPLPHCTCGRLPPAEPPEPKRNRKPTPTPTPREMIGPRDAAMIGFGFIGGFVLVVDLLSKRIFGGNPWEDIVLWSLAAFTLGRLLVPS